MNKFKIFGDLHIKNNKIIDNSIIDFLKENINENEYLIFLGDIFDKFSIPLVNVDFFNFLSKLKNEKIYVLCGNHDISQNRNSLRIVNCFSKSVIVIREYEYFDINDNVRIHFLNYFKNQSPQFELASGKKNILLTHCDMNTEYPPEIFSKFDRVISGHQHDFQQTGKYINIGAVRKCAVNESDDKKYIVYDFEEDKMDFVDFKSTIDIKNVFISDLEKLTLQDKPIILNVYKTGFDDQEELEKRIKKFSWWNDEKIILDFKPYIDKDVVGKLVDNIDIQNEIDFISIFKGYLEYYKESYKIDEIDEDVLFGLFKDFFDKEFSNLKELFRIFQVNFKSIRAENFKLFENIELNFQKYSDIVFIKGINLDESGDAENISSNESGKSNIRNMLEYVILGSDSDVKPLRWGEKSGFVELVFNINTDEIVIKRAFSKSTSSIDIIINGEQFNPTETNTDKILLFFEKYNFKSAIQFIFVSDVGLARYFFSSKNSEKFKIFKDIFPIIEKVSDIVVRIKEITKEKETEYEEFKQRLEGLQKFRLIDSEKYWREYFELQDKKRNVIYLQNEIRDKYNSIHVDESLISSKQKYVEVNNYISTFNSFDINIYKEFGHVKNIFEIYDKNQEILKNVEIKNKQIENIQLNNIKIQERIKNLKNSLSELVVDDSIDKSVEDLLYIKKTKDKILLTEKLKDLGYSASDILHIESSSDKKSEIEYIQKQSNDMLSDVNLLKAEFNQLEVKLEEEKASKGIECPQCGFNIKDNSVLNIIEKNIQEVVNKGKEKESKLKELNIYLESIQKEYSILLERKNQLDKYLTDTEFKLNDLNEIFGSYDTYRSSLEKYIDEDIDKLIEKKRKIDEQKLLKKNLEINLISDNSELNSNNLMIESLNGEISNLKLTVNNEFNMDKYNNICKKISDIGRTKSEYLIRENNIEKVVESKLLTDIDDKNIALFNEKLSEIRNQELLQEQKKELKIKIDSFNRDIEDIEKSYNKLYNSIKESQNKYKLHENKKHLKELKEQYQKFNILHSIMTSKRKINFENYFINHFFEKFEKIFNMYLDVLFERSVKLKIDMQNFTFIDGDNQDILFSEFSNGAKTKLETALIFSINTLFRIFGTNSNILLFDEFIDKGIDSVNLGRIMELLRLFFKDKSVFVVSHKNISEFINQQISVQRKNGKSILI